MNGVGNNQSNNSEEYKNVRKLLCVSMSHERKNDTRKV